MSTATTAWAWVYVVLLGLYALVALFVIPLGLRDVFRLFADLKRAAEEHRREGNAGDDGSGPSP